MLTKYKLTACMITAVLCFIAKWGVFIQKAFYSNFFNTKGTGNVWKVTSSHLSTSVLNMIICAGEL